MKLMQKLDHAAKLFPSVTTLQNSSVFRVAAVLKEDVQELRLQNALEKIIPIYPMLFLQMKKGLFWHYFDENKEAFLVERETEEPCGKIDIRKNKGYFLKVFYYGKRISIEVFHSLTDGKGALELLKSILYYYFDGGEDAQGVRIIQGGVSLEELEDSFSMYYSGGKIPLERVQDSYHIKGTDFVEVGNHVITGLAKSWQIRDVAKQNNCTMTTLLVSMLVYSIFHGAQKYDKKKNPIVVAVPVNLREIFSSKTLKNFFGVVNISVCMDKNMEFYQVVETVEEQLKKGIEKQNLQRRMDANMKFEQNKVGTIVPLPIKNFFIKRVFDWFGENKKTITLSNLGRVNLPKSLEDKIELMEVLLYPTPKSPINCGVISYGEALTINFSKTILETAVIRYFFEFGVKKLGLSFQVYSNEGGERDEKM